MLVERIKFWFVLAMMVVLSAGVDVYAQKSEHYNSPLYSPKKYDPSQGPASGLPEALKETGIEQKLGEQLPLDTELTAEDGRTIKLGSLFESGRPVVLAFVYYE